MGGVGEWPDEIEKWSGEGGELSWWIGDDWPFGMSSSLWVSSTNRSWLGMCGVEGGHSFWITVCLYGAMCTCVSHFRVMVKSGGPVPCVRD